MSTPHPPQASRAAPPDDLEYASTTPASSPPHVTVRGYLTGYVLAVVLTAISFWVVMSGAIQSSTVAGLVLVGLGMVQIVVHMVYFLHMNSRSEGGWNLLALIFTLIMVVVVLTGSMWVMHHMDANMMPMTPHEARTMQ